MVFNKKQSVFNPSEIFEDALKKVKKDALKDAGKTLNVISFAKEMLDIVPYPTQEIILKFVYGGTRYNDDLNIEDKDIDIIKSWSLPNPWLLDTKNCKYKKLQENIKNFKKDPKNNFFRDVVMILGRRSGKSFLSSLIAVYEAYKLIMMRDPKKHYVDKDGRELKGEIWIVNTAITEKQAKTIVFNNIKKMIYDCPMFYGRIGKETEDMMYILTDADIEKNKKIKESGGKELYGNIVIACGNSNSPALRGHDTIAVIYDEMAHYVETDGSASAEEVYTAIEPSCSTFYNWGDGRNIVISTPDLPTGFFFDHFGSAKEIDTMLVFQVPTWDANPLYDRPSLQDKFDKNPDRAASEYGAEFRRSGGNIWIPHDIIDKAIRKRPGWNIHNEGRPSINYYMHIDPAKNNDLWGVLIAHTEERYNPDSRSHIIHIVQDYSRVFKAPLGEVLDPDNIMDNFVLPLFNKFHIVSVSSDAFFSLEQQNKLRKHRINYREVSFNGVCKNKIYETMRDFFVTDRIELCNDDQELQGELKNITIKHTRKNPVIENSPHDKFYPNDDLVDCLGGIINSIVKGSTGETSLPRIRTVYTGMR